MSDGLPIKNGIIIPDAELEITTSKSSGPGGQHANKTETRITIQWNVKTTNALNKSQKARVIKKLQSKLTSDGYLIVNNSESRSQLQNKRMALENLANEIRKALFVPKKRKHTKISKATKEARKTEKKRRSATKKLRSKKIEE